MNFNCLHTVNFLITLILSAVLYAVGSKLKFKMTEFGLEIISTVETEDGQPVEFSTSTSDKNLKKEPAPNQPNEQPNPDDEGTL